MPTALAARLDSIQGKGGINAREVADLLGASPAAVSRWRRGRMPEQDRLRLLLDLDWLVRQLADFYEPDEARLWLFARHPLLQGDRPFDRIKQGQMEDVLTLIDQLGSGAVV
ncbi:MAG: helix-turn-helix domain-containing protein [Chloroflexi bacterium]|nr:helix-turn-helix domain-containing protein [Chloroflexota bacterium]